MRFNPKARLDTSRVRDSGRGGGGGMGGGGMRMPIPGGNMAGGGVGAVVLLILFLVVSMCGGVDLTGSGGPTAGGAPDTSRVAPADTDRYAACATGEDANESEDCARIAVENSLYDFWSDTLPRYDVTFTPASMQTFSGATQTDCGQASSQVGPFYCPVDQGIYLDTTFFEQVLQGALDGPSGAFVEPYVLAHEYGHHIQNLLGTMGRVRTQQGPRSDAVRLELQADCYAGAWTAAATRTQDEGGQALFAELSDTDIRNAIDAAAAVGDDRIQEKTQGQVTQESWTHGSSESRITWFQTGMQAGDDLRACDTWAVETP